MSLFSFKRQLKAYLFQTVPLANIRNVHPTLSWRFRDSGAGYKTADLLTYLLTL